MPRCVHHEGCFSHDTRSSPAVEDFVKPVFCRCIIVCDARLPVLHIPQVACNMSEVDRFVRVAGQLRLEESILALTSVGQVFGLPLRSVSAARNTHTTILELPSQR